MSVLVKGMKMPKSCSSCWISKIRGSSLGEILDCKIIGTAGAAFEDTYDILNNRHPNCPLVALPEKHGRLVDADALIDGYRHMGYDPSEHPEESYMEGWCKGFNSAVDHCMGHVIHTLNIIEAEGDEE